MALRCILLSISSLAAGVHAIAEDSPLHFERRVPLDFRFGFPVVDHHTHSHVPQTVLGLSHNGYKYDITAKSYVTDTDPSTNSSYWTYIGEGLAAPVRAFLSDAELKPEDFRGGMLMVQDFVGTSLKEVGGYRDSASPASEISVAGLATPFVVDLHGTGTPTTATLESALATRKRANIAPGHTDRSKMVLGTAHEARGGLIEEHDRRCSTIYASPVWAASKSSNAPKPEVGVLKLLASVEQLTLVPASGRTPARYASLLDDVSDEISAEKAKEHAAGSTLSGVWCLFGVVDAHPNGTVAGEISRDVVVNGTAGDNGIVDGMVRVAYAYHGSPVANVFHLAKMQSDSTWTWSVIESNGGSIGLIDIGAGKEIFSTSPPSSYGASEVAMTRDFERSGYVRMMEHPVPLLHYFFRVASADVGKEFVLRWEGGSVDYKLAALPAGVTAGISVGLRLSHDNTRVEKAYLYGGTRYDEAANHSSFVSIHRVGHSLIHFGACHGAEWVGGHDAEGVCAFNEDMSQVWTYSATAGAIPHLVPAVTHSGNITYDILFFHGRWDNSTVEVTLPGLGGTAELRQGEHWFALGRLPHRSHNATMGAPYAGGGGDSACTCAIEGGGSSSMWAVLILLAIEAVVAAVVISVALYFRQQPKKPLKTLYDMDDTSPQL